MKNIQFTPNFDLKQFIVHNDQYFYSLPQKEKDKIIFICRILSDKLQAFRASIRRPIFIMSGLRSPSHNIFVGGRPRSYHLYLIRDLEGGVDITFSDINPKLHFEQLKKHFNCVIWYPKKLIYHCDNRAIPFYDFNGI